MEFPGRIKMPFTHLKISARVLEIFNCVKYANEMTVDVIHSTQYYISII